MAGRRTSGILDEPPRRPGNVRRSPRYGSSTISSATSNNYNLTVQSFFRLEIIHRPPWRARLPLVRLVDTTGSEAHRTVRRCSEPVEAGKVGWTGCVAEASYGTAGLRAR